MVLAEQDGAGGVVVEVHPVARATEVGQRCERAQARGSLSVIVVAAAAAGQAVRVARAVIRDRHQIADGQIGAGDVNRLEIGRAADQLARMAAGALEQHGQGARRRRRR